MTGVIKSNRCGTCRKRKVKCDEAKPVCGPCRKGGRACEEPVSRVKFTKPKDLSGAETHQLKPANKPTNALQPCDDIAVIRTAGTEHGASFQTLRLGRLRKPLEKTNNRDSGRTAAIIRPPALSPVESLQLILLETFSYANPGLRLAFVANYLREVPSRLGHSAALDNAVACLVHSHTLACSRRFPGNDRKQGSLYAKTLQSLQAALVDPVEGYSDNTLAAVTIMSRVETLGGGPDGPHFINHAGGASKLIQVRGPSYYQSSFAKLLFLSQRGPSVAVALVRGEDCYLDAPEWRSISCADVHSCQADWLADEMERELTALPSLMRRVRQFHSSSNAAERASVLKQAQQLRRAIQATSEFVTQSVENKVDVFEVPSRVGDTLFPTIYQFSTRTLADVCAFYWGVTIILDTIIARFLPLTSQSAMEILRDRCIRARQQICMSYEYCEQFWPMGCMYMSGPLIMAYHGATAEERLWIMLKLWRIGELMPQVQTFWGPVGLEIASRYFFGEPLKLVRDRSDGEDAYRMSFEENMDDMTKKIKAL